MFYTGDKFPQWKGNMLVGGMAGAQIGRLTLDGPRITSREVLLPQAGRIRDIRQGPDGLIYLVTDDRDGKPTSVYRMEPVARGPVS
jgi:aldose sugar dehydrogenase